MLSKCIKHAIQKTKLNVRKTIKKLRDDKKRSKKECELECFKRIKAEDCLLSRSVDASGLQKKLTDPQSTPIDRVVSKILLDSLIQKRIVKLIDEYGQEQTETFLKAREKNMQNSKNRVKKPKKVDKESSDESEEEQSEVEESPDEEEPEAKQIKTEKPTKKPFHKFERTVDSFFFAPTGENYLSTVEVIKAPEDIAKTKKANPDSKTAHKGSTKVHKKASEPMVRNFSKAGNKEVSIKSKSIVTPKVQAPIAKPEESKSDDIHPSWKAKAQMRKAQIQTFTGMKIKFDL